MASKDIQYFDINDYITYTYTFTRINTLMIGRLYLYDYNFLKNPKLPPLNRLKFFDWKPATFIYEIDRRKKTFRGINFHHMPVRARKIWLNRISKYPILSDGSVRLTYRDLYVLQKQTSAAIRQYKMDRVKNLRRVEAQDWNELFNYYANTFYGVTMDAVAIKYRKFIPKT